MSEEVAYSRNSIVNIDKDNIKVSYGTVNKDGNKVELINRARCGFEYSFDTSSKILKCKQLLLGLSVKSTNEQAVSRYNGNIALLVQIQYWKEQVDSAGAVTGYTDGNIEIIKLYPYIKGETDGYIDSYIIQTNSNEYIKTIYIEMISLDEENTITFYDVTLYNSITVSQAISDTIGFDISFLGVDWYPNGAELAFNGSDETIKLYWNGDEYDEFNGIDVNHEGFIYSRNHSELLE